MNRLFDRFFDSFLDAFRIHRIVFYSFLVYGFLNRFFYSFLDGFLDCLLNCVCFCNFFSCGSSARLNCILIRIRLGWSVLDVLLNNCFLDNFF